MSYAMSRRVRNDYGAVARGSDSPTMARRAGPAGVPR